MAVEDELGSLKYVMGAVLSLSLGTNTSAEIPKHRASRKRQRKEKLAIIKKKPSVIAAPVIIVIILKSISALVSTPGRLMEMTINISARWPDAPSSRRRKQFARMEINEMQFLLFSLLIPATSHVKMK